VKGHQSYQPRGRWDNAVDYDASFIPRVHRLIKLGYDRLNPAEYTETEETTITGDLAEAVEEVLDYPASASVSSANDWGKVIRLGPTSESKAWAAS